MSGYVINFAVYTMAMTGLIFFALMVYKKCMFSGGIKSSKSKMLDIEETITIAPRKTLYVVKAGSERFLIAGDIDKTTLISKLDNTTEESDSVQNNTQISKTDYTETVSKTSVKPKSRQIEVKEELEKLYTKESGSVDDLPVIVDFQKKVQEKNVLHNMLTKINR